MKVDDLLNKLKSMSERGLGELDIGVLFHNTVHDIDQVLVSAPDEVVEDGIGVMASSAIMVYMTRVTRPIYYLDHAKNWRRMDE